MLRKPRAAVAKGAQRFRDPAVARKFASYPPAARRKLLELRALILATAAATKGVGELHETLKWGEPAYLTEDSGSGSMVRIDWKARAPGQVAMYFLCQTTLVDTFRTLFPEDFRFEGNRALLFALDERVRKRSLAYCIAASLTYHLARGQPSD